MTECNIVRDLMPLVIDGAASEESICLVEQHVAACVPCAEVYEELRGEIHAETLAKEQAAFEKAAKKMRRAQRIRRLLAWMVPLLVAVALLVVGGVEIGRLRTTYAPKEPEHYNVRLAQIEGTDQVVLLFTGVDNTGHGINYDYEDTSVRLTIRAYRSVLSLPGEKTGHVSFMQYMQNCRLEDGHIVEEYKGVRIVSEIALTDGETERIVYRDGDAIPMGSPELTAYYKGWQSLQFRGKNESDEEFQTRRDAVEQLKAHVPELN